MLRYVNCIIKRIYGYMDLHPVNSGNLMSKYADDTYLIIPASNANTCIAEVEHIDLQLNRAKSLETPSSVQGVTGNRPFRLQPCQESAESSM